MTPLTIAPANAALVLIDLQKGVVGRQCAPRPAADVVQNAARLAAAFRGAGAAVVLVTVSFRRDFKDRVDVPVDSPAPFNVSALPPDWADLAPELGPREGDITITKRQWGAFYGTDLDLQLRRRAVRIIVLGGIATNFGVESTARDAYERGYHQVFVEDAMTSLNAEAHGFAVMNIFPRIGNVRSTEEVLFALGNRQ